jgi:hypothetical protein
MRNALGVLLAATGAGSVAVAFSVFAALITFGLVLLAGAVLLVIDWDAR